jgi:hypothetical protein
MRPATPPDPAAYIRHSLHVEDRGWPESNCYVDLWIELLHARGHEPLAALPFTFAVDVEGDQWTFFKFPLADLALLYGVEVIELNIWRPLVTHLEEQLALQRPALVEVDAFYLPDTAGTSYRTDHVKTTIAVDRLDGAAGELGYYKTPGYYALAGRYFAGLFRPATSGDSGLPPYVDVPKFGAAAAPGGRRLVAASLELLRAHLDRRPRANPIRRFAVRFASDLEWLAEAPLAHFHGYAFATFRQCGAAFELGGAYLRWLQQQGEGDLEQFASACDVIATTAKALQFRTARLVNAHRTFDPAPMFDVMAEAWDETMTGLASRYGALVSQG